MKSPQQQNRSQQQYYSYFNEKDQGVMGFHQPYSQPYLLSFNNFYGQRYPEL